jgi:hypothetical protein
MSATNSELASFISLRPLYDFIRKHRAKYSEALNLKKPLGESYCRVCECLTGDRDTAEGEACKNLTGKIEETQGLYVWGAFDSRKYRHSIYLGKAGLGKTKKLLSARITEELKDERFCFWRDVFSEERLMELGPQVVRGGDEAWKKYIARDTQRTLRKAGATHIIWAATSELDNLNVRRLEADLIEALNPRANRQKPTPSNHVVVEATRAFSHFRQTIHYIRGLQDERGPFNIRSAS